MNKLVQVFTLLFLIILSPVSAAQESFLKGTPLRNAKEFTQQQKFIVWDLEDLAHKINSQTPIKSVEAFISLEGDGKYIVLDRSVVLAEIDLTARSLVGPWPLIRWPHQTYSPNIQNTRGILGSSYPPSDSYSGVGLSLGCLGDTPLRYGDLESDSLNELIVFNGMFTLFSPQYERTVFAAYLTESDWVRPENVGRRFDEGVPGDHQYVSKFLTDNNGVGAAIRSYSKLYFGHYDGDSHPDILIWRKDYRSNLKTNTTPGFRNIADNVFHYERDLASQQNSDIGVTGEYLPQETTEATIRSWLSSNKLTWAAGYPSESECAGEEGQLIPEMHDPLLNDVDVLPTKP